MLRGQVYRYQIARNLITDYYREKGRTQIISVEHQTIVDPSFNIEEKANLNLDLQRVYAVLEQLKDEYKEVIIWHYVEDLSVSEIAKILKKPEGTVRVILHRALTALKSRLNKNSS